MRSSIVAIHGLNEDHNSAWLDSSSGTLWLRDLLPEHLFSARILLYGYTADVALSAQRSHPKGFSSTPKRWWRSWKRTGQKITLLDGP